MFVAGQTWLPGFSLPTTKL